MRTDETTVFIDWDGLPDDEYKADMMEGNEWDEDTFWTFWNVDGWLDEWGYNVDTLSVLLTSLNPDGNYHVEGVGMGWQRRSGYLDVSISKTRRAEFDGKPYVDGQEFLWETMPNTEYTLRAYADGSPWLDEAVTEIVLIVSHHDSMGERYTITKWE